MQLSVQVLTISAAIVLNNSNNVLVEAFSKNSVAFTKQQRVATASSSHDANTRRHYKLPTTLDEWEEQRMQRVMESSTNKKMKNADNSIDEEELKEFDFYSDMEQPMRYFEDSFERKTEIFKEGPQL
eukprot:CAMPEP_0196809698 /NCGR_PEP_ID=MMETSP1362-20130617/9597_1 /TAXON_ID=163516 /ORGANISM="Leptocylindrus danicus, Strain CCMP1856" /LENGTH=126 /DNA_ID=CAMNT_0042184457 /DNA_START=90 /DNA_END=470 /DNA_ORIENTATION=+